MNKPRGLLLFATFALVFGLAIGLDGSAVPAYALSDNDQVNSPLAQHFFAQRIGANTTSIASSHASPVSHTDAVTDLIVKAAQTVPVGH